MQANSEPNDGDRDRRRAQIARLLQEITRTIQSPRLPAERETAEVVTRVVKTMAAADPLYAERLARSLRHEDDCANALANMAEALAATDPAHAERLIDDIERAVPQSAVPALLAVARALPKTDGSHIRNVLEKAERIVRSDHFTNGLELADIAKAWAELGDHGRAKSVLRVLADYSRTKSFPMSDLIYASARANVMATFDTRGAERIANSMGPTGDRVEVLSDLAVGLVADAPQEAERILQSIPDAVTFNRPKHQAVATIALAMAEFDPGRAERLARSVTEEFNLAPILAELAGRVTESDPARAERLLDEAENMAEFMTDRSGRSKTLAALVKDLADTDPDRAERLAWSMPEGHVREWAVADVATSLVPKELDRAERLIRRIDDGYALAALARAVAASAPDLAEKAARSLKDERHRMATLTEVATALAPTDPDRAEQIGMSIMDWKEKAKALAAVVSGLHQDQSLG